MLVSGDFDSSFSGRTWMHLRVAKLLEPSNHVPEMAKEKVRLQGCRNVSKFLEAVLLELIVEEVCHNRHQSQHSVCCFCHTAGM